MKNSSKKSKKQQDSTFLQLGFLDPASRRVVPGSREARKMTAGSGRKLSACLTSASPLGSVLRTLLESETWGSTEYYLEWKGSATKSGRSIYRLVPSMPRNSDTDIGSWPTPACRDVKGQDQNVGKKPDNNCLPNQVAATWPTPKQPQGSACRTEKNLNHLHRMDDVVPTNGEIMSGCLALTEKFVVRLEVISAWLMGYHWSYLKHWERKGDKRQKIAKYIEASLGR